MKSRISYLYRRDMYDKIPSEDLLARQKFALFRIYTFTAFIASLATTIQITASFEATSFTAILLMILSCGILINFFAVRKVESLPIAYSIAILMVFFVIHTQAYTSGGVMNTGTIYLCILIMTSFMLLGPRGGVYMTILGVLNVMFLYWATEFTSLTSYALVEDNMHLIHQDALFTFILALILAAAQSNYLNSGKNVIIERITFQKDQLEFNNRKLQQYTESLEKSNKELDKFASIVSHDLKAPLRAIGNLTGWIEEDAGETLSGEVKANFDMIKQRVRRMEDLINAILDYSRADRVQGEDEQIEIKKLVEEMLDFIGKPDNVQLTMKNQLPVIFSDRTRLSQVFSNLIGNAIKYNDKKDISIEVSSTETKEGWTFSVKDNGPGIEKQYHEKIFVIFQTLNRRDDVESTGVGLAIVKKIIEDHGGKIWVESEPGKGADFKFFWPRTRKFKDSVLIAATLIV